MVKNRGAGEGFLEEPESFLTGGGPFPTNVLVHELSERDRHVGIVSNEMVIKVSEPKEGLNVFNLLRGQPILDDLNLCFIHAEAIWAYHEA